MTIPNGRESEVRTGWASLLSTFSAAALLFLTLSGLLITFAPFLPATQWSVVVHTAVGLATLLPLAWYSWLHWKDYRHYAMSHIVLLGYVGTVALVLCSVSGLVVTWQGLFGIRSSWAWRQTHLVSTFVVLGAALPHVVLTVVHNRREKVSRPVGRFAWQTVAATVAGMLAIVALAAAYPGARYVNEFPPDYNYLYGPDRPFAPSLARTETGGAFDARTFAGSETCGTAGCHTQIVEEWRTSAHRYAAMDTLFQKIQTVMAEQNGPESTRYCGGCHDPISLFSGTKNIFVENLTGLQGYNEGVSCLACHAIRETDVKGNANYVISRPSEYLWQWSDQGSRRVLRDFLIRTYPAEHNRLSKRMFKAPEYCAACHKQFIDEEINRVGWVQLQNQYDNWASSHWNVKGDPTRSVECRECHMPLAADSDDPAAGDPADYNRSSRDGRHRSHRFIAANQLMPKMLDLDGWEEQSRLTEAWLQGKIDIPEIRSKWSEGPIVQVAIEAPDTVEPGAPIPVRVVLTSNKVGHDYPTGPLDIIQSWVEVRVTDDAGNVVYTSGTLDDKNFIQQGSFLFKAEPVDQFGNLIDRHNLWEMVGVRFRRSLFPGYSDSVEYSIPCTSTVVRSPGSPAEIGGRFEVPAPMAAGSYEITAVLRYRKVDQFLLNFLFGEQSGVSAPVVELTRATATVRVAPSVAAARPPSAAVRVVAR